ncbi:hypothetical protein Leryth_026726 [Lithospermum erythrorhizon]|nr:hypothetical protein Leryth_026726 [Lithospermum erythrorhizon]
MMSNEDEKRCPLCAEEMDWTDQQFKPCKCGYQVCVWCWHHIMDMAEKADTEGRCPACRTIYEKEKIVTMQANCERMASKISNKKNKPPKAKPKTNEVKKDLTNIRVIQRKMAYVIGLPLDLADEDILPFPPFSLAILFILCNLKERSILDNMEKLLKSPYLGLRVGPFNNLCMTLVAYTLHIQKRRRLFDVFSQFTVSTWMADFKGIALEPAKYCHALVEKPGEDSFCVKTAVQTRIRLQQVVGDANNSLGRSGNVLPLPVDELNNTTSASNLDPSPVGMSSSCHVSNMLQSKIKDGGIGAPNKITTFVDVVGRPNSSDSEKDGNIVEDKRILNLCSDLSSLTFDKDVHAKKPYSGHRLYRASSSDHLMKGFYVESNDIPNAPYRENFRSLNIQGSNSCNNMSHRCFLHTSCPKDIQEGSVGQFFLSVNSVPDDRFLETKFQSSAKTDRIYRGSNSFSNEEIVEHLRRIDDEDGNELNNGDENSSLADLERGVISDVVSRILDIGDDSSKLPNSLSEIDDDNKFHHSPSWNSQNSDNTCFPFVKQDIYATQMADYGTSFSNSRHMSSNCSLHLDLGESQDHYSYKSQIPASKPQIIAPPGFSKPRRDPPLGFSASERRDHFSRVSSGNHLMDNSAFLTTFLQNPSTNNGTFGDIDFNDPAILSCGKCRTANGLSSVGFELKGTSPSPQNGFGDEERLWNLMQQSNSVHKDIKLTQSLLPQALSTQQQTWHRSQNGDCISNLDEVYGFSSRLTEQHQAYDPSSLTSLSQQNFLNGHISSSYRYSSDGDQLRNEVSMPDLQRNESLGFSKYFPGYGDMRFQMPVSGDVYTRLFGM